MTIIFINNNIEKRGLHIRVLYKNSYNDMEIYLLTRLLEQKNMSYVILNKDSNIVMSVEDKYFYSYDEARKEIVNHNNTKLNIIL